MGGLFHKHTLCDLNVSAWETSAVTTMAGAFEDAAQFTGNLNSWQTSQVVDMSSMFKGASSTLLGKCHGGPAAPQGPRGPKPGATVLSERRPRRGHGPHALAVPARPAKRAA